MFVAVCCVSVFVCLFVAFIGLLTCLLACMFVCLFTVCLIDCVLCYSMFVVWCLDGVSCLLRVVGRLVVCFLFGMCCLLLILCLSV